MEQFNQSCHPEIRLIICPQLPKCLWIFVGEEPMRQIGELVAVLACGLFAGAAVYVSLIEHPARMDAE
jgi:hypothetical protein